MINSKLTSNDKKKKFLMLKSSFNKSNISKLSLAVGDDEISPLSTASARVLDYHQTSKFSEKDSHINVILKNLPVLIHIRFKIIVPTSQAYGHGVAPYYLCELIMKHHIPLEY